jgi:hypothetical protein
VSPALVDEGPRLVQVAGEAGLPLRLFGGVAIWHRSSGPTREALGRAYADLDFVSHRRGSRELRGLLEAEGYVPERTFNAAHGASRLLYHAPDGAFHIDVFLDQFEMSHKLDFSQRLESEPLTLTGADLLLAKLQVAEVNEKDLSDTAMLLLDHELADEDGGGRLNGAYLDEVCGGDWGLFTTLGDNLDKLDALGPGLALDAAQAGRVSERSSGLRARLEAAPKTRAWKLRARVGRRKRWYEVPEEVHR